jgi:peptidoglycan/LPS O-acetylase OafA/YrhL
MRFAAAMWVVVHHAWPDLSGSAPPALVDKGYLGVELFFVLSGFILSHVYLTGFGEGRFDYGGFLWARLARIYPLHLATLIGLGALAAASVLLGFGSADKLLVWSSLPAQLTLTQAWGLGLQGGWNHPAWSISAEWFAYLAFPAFAWAAWRLRTRPRLAVALALAGLACAYAGFERLTGLPLTQATIAWGALRITPCFAYGCAVWLAWRSAPASGQAWAVARAAALVVAIIAAVALGAPDLVTVALFGGLIFALAALAGSGSRLLSSPLAVYLGEVSFAVYMVCVPWRVAFAKLARHALHAAEGPLPWPLWLAMIAGVVPVAMVAHHAVERPARRLMRAWGEGRSAVRAKAAAATA